MLKDWNKVEQPTAEEVDKRLANAKNSLLQQQIAMKEKKLPVIVLLEGWGAAGKGSVLGKLIKNIDPRFFKVAVMDEPTEEEKRKPCLLHPAGQYWKAVPLQTFCKNSRGRKVRVYGQRLDVRGYKPEVKRRAFRGRI